MDFAQIYAIGKANGIPPFGSKPAPMRTDYHYGSRNIDTGPEASSFGTDNNDRYACEMRKRQLERGDIKDEMVPYVDPKTGFLHRRPVADMTEEEMNKERIMRL